MTDEERNDEPLHDLTGFQRDLLAVVVNHEGDEELHGLGVKERIEAAYEDEEIHHGRLYPNLDTLCDMGLVHKGTLDRRTNFYRPTARGKRELQTHLRWMTGE